MAVTVGLMSHLALFSSPLQDAFLYGAFTYESIYCDLFRLSEPVSTVHGLRVHCWIPVRIVEDHLPPKIHFNYSC